MAVVICPGVHPQGWTDAFLRAIAPILRSRHIQPVIPAVDPTWAWSTFALDRALNAVIPKARSPLLLIAFSAGCVAATGVAQARIQRGEAVRAVVAIDGWGVAIAGPFATYRLSHDAFTHHTSAWLGSSDRRFYAEPAVPHAALWQRPDLVTGWQVQEHGSRPTHARTTEIAFLSGCLESHPDTWPQ